MGSRWLARVWVFALVGAVAIVALGCEARVSLGGRCAGPGECPADLFCVGGRCRASCNTSRDCDEGRRCLRGPAGLNACSTAPDDTCASVDDCADPLFSRCVASRCQTTCVEDAECAGGDCVLGGCVERAAIDASSVGAVALGRSGASTIVVGSFLVADPLAPTDALSLPYDAGYADVAVVVEDAASGGPWTAHVATMQRVRIATDRLDLGVPTRIDVDFAGVVSSRSAVEVLGGNGTTSVAAEPMGDGQPAYFWMIETPDEETSLLYPGQFALFARGTDAPMTMRHDNYTQRFPAQAAVVRGLGDAQDGPGWGLRVVDGARSEYQVVGPMGGGGSESHLDLSSRGPVDVEASERALVLREEDGSVRFVRLEGPENITAAAFSLVSQSTCAPGLTDRFVVASGNYVAATCEGAVVTLHRIVCPSAEGRGLEACDISAWLTLTEPTAPTGVALETWPGGVVVVTRDGDGVHLRPVSDEATMASASMAIRYDAVLPVSYRVDALTDFQLLRSASNAATRGGAAIVVVAGLYRDDNDVAEVRVGVLEVSAVR